MRLSVEILDHIFSFLLSHREFLIACSKDPLLSPIIERHVYYHVVVHVRHPANSKGRTFEAEHVSQLVSENTRILNYVRILEIEPDFSSNRHRQSILRRLDKFANTLLMFPLLECIMLTSRKFDSAVWYWSDVFQAALRDRLNLPTIKEVHFIGSKKFPFSFLDTCKHVKNLSLSGSFDAGGRFCNSTLPQLKSLTLSTECISSSLLTWLKSHIDELQSLKCAFFSVEALPELLGVCSQTLTKLEVDFTNSGEYSEFSDQVHQVEGSLSFSLEKSLFPPNLQQLTIRTAVHACYQMDPDTSISNLLAAAEVVTQFLSSPRRSTILDIDIDISAFTDVTRVDFSPLTVLGAASLLIPRINLYVHAGIMADITSAQLMPCLEDYEDIMRPVEAGVLVIHPGMSAPEL